MKKVWFIVTTAFVLLGFYSCENKTKSTDAPASGRYQPKKYVAVQHSRVDQERYDLRGQRLLKVVKHSAWDNQLVKQLNAFSEDGFQMTFNENHDKNSWEGNQFSNFGPALVW